MEGNLCRGPEASGSRIGESTDETFALVDAEATRRFGAELAKHLPRGAILLLQGDLGAGKTCLVQGMAEAMGIDEPITSPTFALAQHYLSGRQPLVHLDLYRLETPGSADELFLQEEEEARAIGAVLAVEWPERLSINLPEAWRLTLEYKGDGRQAELSPPQTGNRDNAPWPR